MYIRCSDCLTASWIGTIRPGGEEESASCSDCGRAYVVDARYGLGLTVREHHQKTMTCAVTNGIDMASAYSVLLGIMQLDQAKLIQRSDLPGDTEPERLQQVLSEEQRREEALRPPPTDASPEPVVRTEPAVDGGIDLDPGFTQAVKDGCLSVQEALSRGDRDVYANRLIERHQLAETIAYLVADNRISLRRALLEKRSPVLRAVRHARHATPLQKCAVLGTAAVLVIGVTLDVWSKSFTVEPPRTTAVPQVMTVARTGSPDNRVQAEVPPAEITRSSINEMGELVELVGPDPRSVLIAYCKATGAVGNREPIEITDTVPAFPSARLGVFRDYDNLEHLLTIRIRQERKTRRWVAGGGQDPIPVREAPDLPRDARRLPIGVD